MISVIVCSHNPRREYIARTMEGLRRQNLDPSEWELVVVDNASASPLATFVDLTWHPQGRHIEEPQLGLTPARLRGIRESSGDVLVFVDDDNVLDDTYLSNVRKIAGTHGFLGAWSGNVTGGFEQSPPEWTRRYWTLLVVRDVERDAWSNLYDDDRTTPLGAGLCVRRPVAAEYTRVHEEGLRPRQLDRAGSSLVSGGDNDLSACALDLGFGCGLMTSLRLTHLIPPERLSEDYLLRLVENVSYSSGILRSFRAETRPAGPRKGLGHGVLTLIRKMRMTPRERRFHAAAARGAARAEAELRT